MLSRLVWAALVACSCFTTIRAVGRYDPCAAPGKLAVVQLSALAAPALYLAGRRGGGFYLGIAIWPGGTAVDWGPVYNSTTGHYGISPCNTTGLYNGTQYTEQQYLESRGVVFSTYVVRVDTLNVFKTNITLLQDLFDQLAESQPPVLTAVVFRGLLRSEAHYLRSDDADLTHAAGLVTTLAILLTVDTGEMKYIHWDDQTCTGCGGMRSAQCLTTSTQIDPQRSCATDLDTCSMVDCSPAVYIGFSGSDKYGQAFQTGDQMTRISQFAIGPFFDAASGEVIKFFNDASNGIVDATSEAPAQQDSSVT